MDLYVFLGDYEDSFNESDTQMIRTVSDVIKFKKDNMSKVELLLGNHDAQYFWLSNSNFRCSGFRPEIAGIIHQLFVDNTDLFNFAIQLDDTIISHAGICASWMKRFRSILEPYSLVVNNSNIVSLLNMCIVDRVSREALECIGQVGKSRGGYEAVGGPIWADKSDLMKNYVYGVNQIVGHTPQWGKEPFTFYTDDNHTLKFIDISEGSLNHPCIVEYNEMKK